MKKAFMIRLDRMGDLILTLPCDQLVNNQYEVHWLIPEGLDFVVSSSAPKRTFATFSSKRSWAQFKKLWKLTRDLQPDVSVSFHVPWWVNFTLWLARVKVRGGVLSQWHSYLFLNRGLRQKRSQVEFHEMEYNYQLTEHVFGLKINREKWTHLKLEENQNESLQFDVNQKYFVVHPGMGGSALNWPSESYATLIDRLSEQATVVITGTHSDESYLIPLKMLLKNNHKVVWLDKQLNGYQLLKLLKNANANIAPSTGVLHLSASLGVPSIGIFSPIKVHHENRWGPRGNNTATFTPKVECPAHFECVGQDCKYFSCMSKMPIEPVLQKALTYL